jgi:antitoxin ParD1/3/4
MDEARMGLRENECDPKCNLGSREEKCPLMSGFDITFPFGENCSMNVSLTEPMEKFVRQKVAVGEYETASEVVREALRLLRQRDEVWKADVRSKITQGMDSVRADRTIPAEKVKKEMAAFKKKWKKDGGLQ